MKIIITEEQQKTLLQSFMDEMFNGYTIEYVKDSRKVYVGNELMMIMYPTNCIMSNKILNKSKEILFYDTMMDFKEEVSKWVVNEFKVKASSEFRYSVQFRNLSGIPEPPKERKKTVRDKKPEVLKKNPSQKTTNTRWYSNFIKGAEQEKFDQKRELIKKRAEALNKKL